MAEHYPNREFAWHSERGMSRVAYGEVVRRIGSGTEEVVRLSGGLANDTLRVGSGRVLRIYRRDASALPRERALLARDWRQLRVPRILGRGDDFLVLEYVEHRPLLNTAAHGAAVGKALAEIHRVRFDRYGLFGDAIEVEEAWEDFPAVMDHHIRSRAAESPRHTALLERVADWIARRQDALRRECSRPVLLHGDFKPSNLHWTEDGRLLVLDWEFAYAGPTLMDIGQLARWGMPQPFREGFEQSYLRNGGVLPENWMHQARCFDLVNLAGLLIKSSAGSRQAEDCRRCIERIVAYVS